MNYTAADHCVTLLTNPAWGWTPAGSYAYTSTPITRPSAMGDERLYVVRRRASSGYTYGAFWLTQTHCLRAAAGTATVLPADRRTADLAVMDSEAVEAVANWGARKNVVRVMLAA